MSVNMNIHEKISFIRNVKKLDTQQFANMLEVSIETIKDMENALIPDFLFLKKLVDTFNIDLVWLFSEEIAVAFENKVSKDYQLVEKELIHDRCDLQLDFNLLDEMEFPDILWTK